MQQRHRNPIPFRSLIRLSVSTFLAFLPSRPNANQHSSNHFFINSLTFENVFIERNSPMITVSRASVVLLIVLGSLAGFAFGTLVGSPEPGTNPLPGCATEDSTNCYWDSSQHGNGSGLSFVDINGIAYYPNAVSETGKLVLPCALWSGADSSTDPVVDARVETGACLTADGKISVAPDLQLPTK
jgi:hypothetical protein